MPSRLESWTFKYFEDLFAEDAGTPTVVNVTSKAYRAVALYEPGNYTAYLKYYNGMETVAHWLVREPNTKRKAKNVVLFIGDGSTPLRTQATRPDPAQ
jgi:alkaline phosphatase